MSKELSPVQRAEAAETKLNEVVAERDKLQGELTTAKESTATAQKSVTELTNKLTAETDAHAATKLELSQTKSKLQDETQAHTTLKNDFESKVNLKAAEIVRSQGIEPLKTKVNDTPGNPNPGDGGKKKDALASLSAGAKADLAKHR